MIAKTNLSAFLILELIVSILFIFFFGFLNFFMIVFAGMFLGAIFLTKTWTDLITMQNTNTNFFGMIKLFSLTIVGILLLIPGILSTFLAILLLLFILIVKFFYKQKKHTRNNSHEDEIIDVEIIGDDKK
ncbi:FxsA family protein [Campylobacter insulaenigrae]|uniref:Integral memnbrane protein n=2 Tax=Campylobacter insulaenigrae TaxID=260714 RepID=A0ABY3G2A8_9BACT|nr:FxsA family protein [Campylobacter insulaenigrae]AJC87711.1 putative membrane protein [Campylobacter insulaenigrae NCTC 12927]MCR6570092.1 FxsA family protein [Campylobacter insulaenigrae]MCR6573135.1 FxsA family protein [Campylobacter insulaenigrae]MCR6579005.1 FxsA family protein [Campylobacter insulaenigrae]MCR6580418.1 FxsA family protein [Campylobacter insulaenigrae]